MRRRYVIPLLLFALGLGLVMYSTSGGASISIFGFNVVIQVVRGVGIIAIISSAIAFLVTYGNTIPPKQHHTSPPTGDTHGKSEDLPGPRHLSRRP
jgi:hypothetical protein